MATIKKRPRATQGEKLIERLEELDDKSQQQVIDYVFGLTVDKSKALNEEIQFDTMADMIDEINEKYRWAVIHWQIGAAKMERERDEARQALENEMKWHHQTHTELVEAQCKLLDMEYDKLKS